MKFIISSFFVLFSSFLSAQTPVRFDFTGDTQPLKEQSIWSRDGVTATISGAAYRMATKPSEATSVGQTVSGLGVASPSDWDTALIGFSTINYSFTGPGETLVVDFDREVSLDKIRLGGLLASGAWITFAAVVQAVDENNNSIGTIGLSPTASVLATADSGTTLPAVASDAGVGELEFDATGALPKAKRFTFSGIIGIDHIDTHYILAGLEVTPTPIPEVSTSLLLGLAGLVTLSSRRRS